MATTPNNVSREDFIRSVDHAIQARQTTKVLGRVDLPGEHPLDLSPSAQQAFDEQVTAAVKVAGWAPFHHSRKALDVNGQGVIHEPWRFYHLDRRACLALIRKIDDILDPGDRRGKVPGLLAAAGALLQITWLPESSLALASEGEPPEREETEIDKAKLALRNQEHLAAASAAVQNLLLAAEARGLQTYWSSGGLLRDERVFRLLKIPADQQLLGSVFLAPSSDTFTQSVDTQPGGLRGLRAPPEHFCRRIVLQE